LRLLRQLLRQSWRYPSPRLKVLPRWFPQNKFRLFPFPSHLKRRSRNLQKNPINLNASLA